ncbi:hypothetical protein [Mesoplasma melaleucae]|uniref:Uncharacterized protein n=1 Tax=Mesoplasma melaleucae TaxID=81459 RepID=A0A2K8NZ12_9MOLU|nr:hypothetical protein [Mesoplasma melaleucae]ATZ17883.1 hypothetical protein EMELA_v1c03120 [Mesoplasma melaleucae]
MSNNTNSGIAQNFPSWAIAILIILFIVGLIIGCWGFLSGFKLKRKDNTTSSFVVWNKLFKDKKAVKAGQKFETNKGVFALTFANVDKKDFFLPIYIFKSEDFEKDSNEIILKIVEGKFEIINEYMSENSKTINDMFFVLLENDPTDDKKEEWIKLINSKSRGFNT